MEELIKVWKEDLEKSENSSKRFMREYELGVLDGKEEMLQACIQALEKLSGNN